MSPKLLDDDDDMHSEQGGAPSSNEYKMRRDRNNVAVKKSRLKSKEKTDEMKEKVDKLKLQNTDLEGKINTLLRELEVLKGLFIEHADSAHGIRVPEIELAALLKDDDDGKMMNDSQESLYPPSSYDSMAQCISPGSSGSLLDDPSVEYSLYSPQNSL